MGFCDASAVDWEAVGAVGTWVIGIAAGFLAWRANSIAMRFKRAEDERQEAAAKAMITGLRLEASHFSFRLENFGKALIGLAQDFSSDALAHAMASSRLLERVSLSDDSTKAALRAALPETLNRQVAFLYGTAHTVHQSFEGTEEVLADLEGGKVSVEKLVAIERHAEAFLSVAARVSAINDEMGAYLGVKRDEEQT